VSQLKTLFVPLCVLEPSWFVRVKHVLNHKNAKAPSAQRTQIHHTVYNSSMQKNMNKILILSMLSFSIHLNAQRDTSILFKEPSDSTGFGTADGKPVSQEIGVGGGHMVSDDGRVELIFPDSALEQNTVISIQPTKNLAPNGVGKSYLFEPSGTQFKKAVHIVFHYTNEEAEICPPDLMGLAMQDHTGKWTFFDYDDWDSAGGTLKGSIHHFSGITNVNKIQLQADKDLLGVWEESFVWVNDISRLFKGVYDPATFLVEQYRLWLANNILGGDQWNGMINEQAYRSTGGTFAYAVYHAPKILPAKNAVKITLQIHILKGKNNVSSLQKSLSCYILIYEDYDVKISMDMGKGFGSMQWVDESSFTMRVTKYVVILEGSIKNQNLDVKGKTGCARYINKAKCSGPIHVTGISKYKLTPGKPFTQVDIFFDLSEGVVEPQFEVTSCPGAIGPPTPLVLTQRWPTKMSFFATDKPVLLSLWKDAGGVVQEEDPNDIIAKIEPPNWDDY